MLHSCGDEARRAALPDSTGFPGELLAQRVHSINYDQSWEITGGSLVFAGAAAGCAVIWGSFECGVIVIAVTPRIMNATSRLYAQKAAAERLAQRRVRQPRAPGGGAGRQTLRRR